MKDICELIEWLRQNSEGVFALSVYRKSKIIKCVMFVVFGNFGKTNSGLREIDLVLSLDTEYVSKQKKKTNISLKHYIFANVCQSLSYNSGILKS